MKDKSEFVSRRKVLQMTGVALGSLSVVNTASAQKGRPELVRTIDVDVSSIKNVEEARVELFADGSRAIEAVGTEVSVADDNIFGVHIGTKDMLDTSGKYRPDKTVATVQMDDLEHIDRKPGMCGGSKKAFASGQHPGSKSVIREPAVTDNTVDPQGVSTNKRDRGTDYTTDYQGGLQVSLREAFKNDINHGQTSRWSANNGQVTKYNDRYWCWYAGAFAVPDHQSGGFLRTDWSGNTLLSKSYSQFYMDLSYASYNSYHYATLIMKPSGRMGWRGRCYTQGNDGQFDPPDISFALHTNYWTYCKNWAR